jgi:CDP-diacylglycerol--glycerol-3-phosphate 3-phosphatidyltransferase
MKSGFLMSVYYLLVKARRPVRLVNAITFFRVAVFPFFIVVLILNRIDIFKWLLLISFLTDALDGFLARKLKANSILGARLDSIGDDLTVLAGLLGMFVFRWEFLKTAWIPIVVVLGIFIIQTLYALFKYQKTTSFHTLGAKTAAMLQGMFLCSLFFFNEPVYWLFYAALVVTALELVEEIVMVTILPKWKSDVLGIYWALKIKNTEQQPEQE